MSSSGASFFNENGDPVKVNGVVNGGTSRDDTVNYGQLQDMEKLASLVSRRFRSCRIFRKLTGARLLQSVPVWVAMTAVRHLQSVPSDGLWVILS